MALQFQPNYIQSLMSPGIGGGYSPNGESDDDLFKLLHSGGVAAPQDQPMPAALAGVGTDLGLTPAALPSMATPDLTVHDSGQRRSVLDVIGGLGDVFAKVGGADAQYQPQVDARNERARQVDMDQMRHQQFDMQQRTAEGALKQNDVDVAKGQFELDAGQRGLLGQAANGLSAIYDAHGAEGVQKAWPILAKQLNLTPEQTATFGQSLQDDPEGAISAVHEAMAGPDKSSGSQAREIQLYNVAKKEDPTLKFNDFLDNLRKAPMTDYQRAHLGLEGRGVSVKEHQQAWAQDPNNPLNIQRLTPKGGGKNAAGGVADPNVPGLLSNIENGFVDLHKMGALPGSGNGDPVAGTLSALGRTGLGQKIGEQMNDPAAQKRVEIAKNVSALQQAMLKSLPASATRTKFEQEMLQRGLPDATKMSLETARTVIGQLRKSYAEAVAGGGATPRPRVPGTLSTRPAAGGWKVIGVH